MITIAHRIQLMPNNKQKTYFQKAIGCCRFSYNWGLQEWQRRISNGERCISGNKIRNAFNEIRRKQFPWTYEVTKYATSHAFDDLQAAFNDFFSHRANYPMPHKKKENRGSFYVGNDAMCLSDKNKSLKNVLCNFNGKHQYLKIYKLGYVKMAERMRFNGKVMGVRISQDGDKFFASFTVRITEEEYLRTHPKVAKEKRGAVGIDLGLKEAMVLSGGIAVHNPRIMRKHQRKITRLSRQLNKRQHARTKQERLQGVKRSSNYRKLAVRLGKEQRHVTNIRKDFQQKLTSVLTTAYGAIAIEDLNVSGMMKNHKLAKSVSDVSFFELRRQLEYKAALNGVRVEVADRWFASSKTCSCCGHKHDGLTLKDRTFICPKCGFTLDRDLNAAINLRGLIKEQVGVDYPELTPADLTVLLSRFTMNWIATSKVETGRQRKKKNKTFVSLPNQ